jgi:large subunit ribosomal protein L25
MSTATLTAQTRTDAGKGVARALRREGKIPGVLYGKGSEPVSLSLSQNEVRLQYIKGRFRSRILELQLDGKTVKALPRDVQTHPVTDQIEHVDFLKIDANTTIRVAVPVKFLGTDKSAGIKRGGVLNVVRHTIEFICKPDAIPAHIDIDVQKMEIGDSVHINDLQLPAGLTSVIKRNFTIATIAGRNTKEEEAATPAADAAAPAAGAAPAAAAAPAKKDEKK